MGKIMIKFTYPEGYTPVYVNGAMGGLGPENDIVINFFFEKKEIPNILIHQIAEDGSIGNPVEIYPPDSDSTFIRAIQNGIVMDRKNAVHIYEWLGQLLHNIGELSEE